MRYAEFSLTIVAIVYFSLNASAIFANSYTGCQNGMGCSLCRDMLVYTHLGRVLAMHDSCFDQVSLFCYKLQNACNIAIRVASQHSCISSESLDTRALVSQPLITDLLGVPEGLPVRDEVTTKGNDVPEREKNVFLSNSEAEVGSRDSASGKLEIE